MMANFIQLLPHQFEFRPSSCLSTSGSFIWKIAVEDWLTANVADTPGIHLMFETALPLSGKDVGWILDVGPNGQHGVDQVKVKLYMEPYHFDFKKDPSFQVETAFRFRKASDTEPLDMYSTQSYRAFHSSELATEDDIWTTLGDLHELKAEECAVDGILSFEFEIRTVMSPKKNFTDSVSKQRQFILKNFEHFQDDSSCDVKLICEGEEFPCHKLLLISQSPVFRAMFAQDCIEKSESSVAIQDCKSEAVQEFLFFLYHTKHQHHFNAEQLDLAFDLVHLASKYQVELLIASCRDLLLDLMNIDNVLKLKVLADKYPELEPITVFIDGYMKKNITEIVKKDDWSEFIVNNVNLVGKFICNHIKD